MVFFFFSSIFPCLINIILTLESSNSFLNQKNSESPFSLAKKFIATTTQIIPKKQNFFSYVNKSQNQLENSHISTHSRNGNSFITIDGKCKKNETNLNMQKTQINNENDLIMLKTQINNEYFINDEEEIIGKIVPGNLIKRNLSSARVSMPTSKNNIWNNEPEKKKNEILKYQTKPYLPKTINIGFDGQFDFAKKLENYLPNLMKKIPVLDGEQQSSGISNNLNNLKIDKLLGIFNI